MRAVIKGLLVVGGVWLVVGTDALPRLAGALGAGPLATPAAEDGSDPVHRVRANANRLRAPDPTAERVPPATPEAPVAPHANLAAANRRAATRDPASPSAVRSAVAAVQRDHTGLTIHVDGDEPVLLKVEAPASDDTVGPALAALSAALAGAELVELGSYGRARGSGPALEGRIAGVVPEGRAGLAHAPAVARRVARLTP